MDGHISVGTAGLITDRLEKRITAHSNFLLSVIITSANYFEMIGEVVLESPSIIYIYQNN